MSTTHGAYGDVLAPGVPVKGSWARFDSPSWPLVALFMGLPLWWFLGITAVVLPAVALVMLLPLMERRSILVPRGFGLWLLFLGWTAASALQIQGMRELLSFAYRSLLYLGATVLFLYVLNTPRTILPSRKVVNLMAGFFAVIVVGGFVGMLSPAVSFRTPAEILLPRSLLTDPFIFDQVHASTTTTRAFAAYPIYRPKAPFPYTNQWTATYAVALPFGLAALWTIRSRRIRRIHAGLLIASVAPLVFSLGRGGWLTAGAALVYGGIRAARRRNAGPAAVVLGAVAVGALLLLLTPLGDIIRVRLEHGYSDQGRMELYAASFKLAGESPVLGYGSPVSLPGSASAGTHGQLWTVLVSNGYPGTALFLGWFLWALFRSGLRRSAAPDGDGIHFWCHLVIFTALIQLPFYPFLPWGLPVAMIAAALAWRDRLPSDAEDQRLE